MAIGRGQFLAERRERVAVTRRRGVGRKLERRGDLLEGEFAPDLEDENLALFGRQALQGLFDGGAAFVAVERSLEYRPVIAGIVARAFLACDPAAVAPREIE